MENKAREIFQKALGMKPIKLSDDVKRHYDKYWKLSIKFFEESDFALASFFAITLIEEVGKLTIMRIESLGGKFDKKGFYNHHQKYRYAAYDNLIVNSRVTRIYGNDESKFAELIKKDELFKIRNNALYLENGMIVPENVVSRDTAFLLVCFAGEIYAEIQGFTTGTGPDDWQRILEEVDEFRKTNE
ncbi:AbiV family abortive infection protein [Methanobacterium oryzae]|uniref:AbiV family abortive infection protein n=1 Tax=Methanobacterium oryzae TaxID=69540 RepID=UPI003D1C1991